MNGFRRRSILWLGVLMLGPCVLATGCQSTRQARHARKAARAEEPLKVSMPQNSANSLALGDPHQMPPLADLTPEREAGVLLDLGKVHEVQDNYDAAIATYQQALTLGGAKLSVEKQALAHRRIAAAYDRLGHFEQAETHYKEALRLTPKDLKVWNNAGYSYYLQGRYDEAEHHLRQAAQLDPNDTRVQTNLGLVLGAAGKEHDALSAFSRAGGAATGHSNLAYILASTGQTHSAREHYEAALQYQPSMRTAKHGLAKLDNTFVSSTEAENLASANSRTETRPSPSLGVPMPPPAEADPQLRRTSASTATGFDSEPASIEVPDAFTASNPNSLKKERRFSIRSRLKNRRR